MTVNEAIEFIEKQIPDPTKGLLEEVFLLVTRITPMINVDLLIKDENNRTLLSWRNDVFHQPGWHVPGGIIRYKETFETRIKKVAEIEIGTVVKFDPVPIALNQIILEQKNRGHFISLLYKCFVPSTFVPENKGLSENDAGYLKWHKFCPDNLLKVQDIYRTFI